ncbi:hypothetical protein AA0X71_08670 [Robertmurraya sp. 2P01SA]|uniref:hypothetical protein n=1 Tax=Robertmurraya sp. 2P01SA TaxID=3132300 RepID=UPI0039A7763C
MEETLKLILNELKELKEGQQNLKESQQEFKEDLQNLKESQQEFKEDLQNLKESQQEFKEDLQNLKESQQEFKEDLQNLKESQQEFKEDLQNLKESQQELIEGQQELKRDVSSIKDNLINGLGPYFEQIEKHIDEQTVELKETLEDQQRVIDTLAARSVRHESEIKDFKRILRNQ